MRTAGTHFVIDTDTARRKRGVLAEALAFAEYKRRARNNPPPGKGNPSDPPEPGANGGRNPLDPTQPGGNGGEVAIKKRPIVEIYGAKKRCPRTQQAIQLFKDAGAEVKYYDVDASPSASKVVVRNTKYLEGGQLLPFIRVDGKPIYATSEGVGRALQLCKVPK